MQRASAWILTALPLALLVPACGPIESPPDVVDLRTTPLAFQSSFDRNIGVPRLVLLLSPA